MPYIDQERRDQLAQGDTISTPGDLNYCFTRDIIEFVQANGESYTTFNAVLGALDACAKEFYRRRVAAYEDRKIIENGDVF